MHLHFGCNAHILEEMCIWETHLHLYFSCNAHILENVCAFGGSHLHLYFGCNAHLFWRRCTLKYNCIHMFIEEVTLIKYYCNPYHISSRLKKIKLIFQVRCMNHTHTQSHHISYETQSTKHNTQSHLYLQTHKQ